jgi:alkylation response protein AidB-like acyl-CoA dehydrogenase
MDTTLSEEQEMLKRTARDFLTKNFPHREVKYIKDSELGYSPELWQEIAKLGWMGLVFPEDYGGANMTFLDLCILLEEMGRVCMPGPYFATVILAGMCIADFGTEKQKKEYLAKIASGQAILTLALTEPNARYDAAGVQATATADGDDYIITGTKLFVPDANVADHMLVVARTDDKSGAEEGITVFIVDAKSPGIDCTVLRTIAKDKLCEVAFDRVRVAKNNILGQLNQGWKMVEKTIEGAAVAKCCDMVGGAQQVLDMTVDYAKQRVQFGQPIGSFQAIQHHCANMLIDVDTARLITYEAAWKLSKGLPCCREVAMAKAWASDVYRRVTILGHQVQGGVSIIEDHSMPLYFKAAKAAELAFGDARYHRSKLADMLGSGSLTPIEPL